MVGLTYPRCIASFEAVFEPLASFKAFVGARGVVGTHGNGHATHPRTFAEKAKGSFYAKDVRKVRRDHVPLQRTPFVDQAAPTPLAPLSG